MAQSVLRIVRTMAPILTCTEKELMTHEGSIQTLSGSLHSKSQNMLVDS